MDTTGWKSKKRIVYYLRLFLTVLLLCALFADCSAYAKTPGKGSAVQGFMPSGKKQADSVAAERRTLGESEVRIVAVGDNLIHQAIIDGGLQKDGTLCYDRIYSRIKNYMAGAQVKLINQETCLVKDSCDYSGYPTFGSPYEIGEAAINAGFNVFTLATNHSYDKESRGLKQSLEFFEAHPEVLTTGMYTSQEDYDNITIGEYNGIRIAFLNYTYGTNLEIPASRSYYVKKLDFELIKKEIKKARESADFVIVLPHWGIEYQLTASEQQKEAARFMADAGADLIIGTHPHVVEPLNIIRASDGREVPCYYSLGNFISNMFGFNTTLEAIADVTIRKTQNGVQIVSCDIVPLINHIDATGTKHVAYPLNEYTVSLAASRAYGSQLGDTASEGIENIKRLFECIIEEKPFE